MRRSDYVTIIRRGHKHAGAIGISSLLPPGVKGDEKGTRMRTVLKLDRRGVPQPHRHDFWTHPLEVELYTVMETGCVLPFLEERRRWLVERLAGIGADGLYLEANRALISTLRPWLPLPPGFTGLAEWKELPLPAGVEDAGAFRKSFYAWWTELLDVAFIIEYERLVRTAGRLLEDTKGLGAYKGPAVAHARWPLPAPPAPPPH